MLRACITPVWLHALASKTLRRYYQPVTWLRSAQDMLIPLCAGMAKDYAPRKKHDVPALLRLSGLEPLEYRPDASNMRKTFLKIGERCNVAGSSIYKKAIVDGDFDKAASIATKQACSLLAALLLLMHAGLQSRV